MCCWDLTPNQRRWMSAQERWTEGKRAQCQAAKAHTWKPMVHKLGWWQCETCGQASSLPEVWDHRLQIEGETNDLE